MSVLTSGRWPLGRTAGPCRRGFLSDTTPPPSPRNPPACPHPASRSPGSQIVARVGDTLQVSVSASGCLLLGSHFCVPTPISLCVLPLPPPSFIAHPGYHPLSAGVSPLRAGVSSVTSIKCACGGGGGESNFSPFAFSSLPPPPPTYLWDVSQPLECLVTNPGLLKCSSRVPQ